MIKTEFWQFLFFTRFSNIIFYHFPQFHGAPLEYMDVLADCNLVFTILFTIECAMKLTSFGPKVKILIIIKNLITQCKMEFGFLFITECNFYSILLGLFQRFLEHLWFHNRCWKYHWCYWSLRKHWLSSIVQSCKTYQIAKEKR